MSIRLFGEQDRHRLDFIARNIYTLTQDEFRVMSSSANEEEYILEVRTSRKIDPFVRITIINNGLSAQVSFYPGINSSKMMTYQEVILILVEQHKASLGYIKEEVIKETLTLLQDEQIVENVVVAEGTEPIHGKDAIIEFLCKRPSQKPKLLPNGKVNYKEFDKFIIVSKDDLIAKRVPPYKGKDGRDFTGQPVKAIEGADKFVDVIDGVYTNSEKTEYRAKYNGHIVLSGNTVSVLPILEINGDVNMRVGNIRFDGTVHVSGNVLSDFLIEADDIVVDGIVENAELKARDTIVVRRGIKGVADRGSLRATNSISVGYCENATIISGGDVTIDKYSFNSSIQATNIIATGKNTIINGGLLEVYSTLEVTNLGSKNSGRMNVIVGYSPILKNKADKVKVEINQLNSSIDKINTVLSRVDLKDKKVLANPKVKMLLDSRDAFRRRLPLLERKYNDLVNRSVCKDPRVKVINYVYPGVVLKMLSTVKSIGEELSKAEFYIDYDKQDISILRYEPQQ